jgi:hypothetical protein
VIVGTWLGWSVGARAVGAVLGTAVGFRVQELQSDGHPRRRETATVDVPVHCKSTYAEHSARSSYGQVPNTTPDAVGSRVGLSDGTVVGVAVVGAVVGARVGTPVGPDVGSAVVGAEIGVPVGLAVGTSVGEAVGASVVATPAGATVGVADGACVHVLQSFGQSRRNPAPSGVLAAHSETLKPEHSGLSRVSEQLIAATEGATVPVADVGAAGPSTNVGATEGIPVLKPKVGVLDVGDWVAVTTAVGASV